MNYKVQAQPIKLLVENHWDTAPAFPFTLFDVKQILHHKKWIGDEIYLPGGGVQIRSGINTVSYSEMLIAQISGKIEIGQTIVRLKHGNAKQLCIPFVVHTKDLNGNSAHICQRLPDSADCPATLYDVRERYTLDNLTNLAFEQLLPGTALEIEFYRVAKTD